jgi:hypothetical protein
MGLTACGGSGDGSVADGGIGGTGISSGSISAIGSIVVNGRRFEVESAEITVNGTPAPASALEVGYVVGVRGDFQDGIAESVEFVPNVIGPIPGNDIAAGADKGTLTIMQQVVHVTSTTIFTNVSGPGALAGEDRVLVSGFRNSNQEIVASHIRLLPGTGDFPQDQIVGRVALDSDDGFAIAGLRIDYPFRPGEGERVIARGSYSGGTPPTFAADSVETVDDLGGDPDDEVELEGIVGEFTNLSSPFTVEGVPVDGSGATIEGGEIGLDAEVEVDGSFGLNGVLIARRIEVDREENVEIEARVSSVSSDLTTVRFFNDELSVRVTDRTRLKDDTNEVDAFGVGDIAPGNFLEIDGYVADDGASVIATRLEREDPEDSTTIAGPVQDVVCETNLISLLGIQVNIDGAEFDDGGSCDDITTGTIVELTWNSAVNNLSTSVDEVEIEDADD